jgi:hypothetical protein
LGGLFMDLEQFILNRNAFRSEELARLVGKHVAWSPDGTRIVACDDDPLKVVAAVKAAGYDPGETLIEAITPSDEISWGGASLGQAVAEETA